ncbi:MAG: thiamine transport system ATP-binding protein [Candidatus Aldehydirespiratoraceae bacterium]|jgi:thiamine transport system ATP-binding protein
MWTLDQGRVTFGETVAVDDVSLEIAEGEIVVILGPSGCGKSTLLRTVAGLQPLDAGRFLIGGDDAARRLPHERDIGLMFQDPTLFPHRNVGQNIEFGLRMSGMAAPDRAQRTTEMLELVGLSGYEHRDVATLSGGEAQRVALARAMAPMPRLLLLDEPFGALDRARRDGLVEELPQLLRSTGTAAVHVTHDHDEAFAIADRIAVMTAGRILRTDVPDRLYADPQTETVARFLGHTNIVDDPATGRRVIRRDAATITPSGELAGTVERSRFRGDHHDVTVATELGSLDFRLSDAATVGQTIQLRIDPARTASIVDD